MSFSSPTLNRSRALLQRPWRALSGYAVVALLFVPASVLAQASDETGFVFTADERGSSISCADLATGIVTTIAVTVAPHNVQISADGQRLLVVGASADPAHGAGHGHAGGAGRLLVLDPRALNEPAAQIEVGDHPAHVVTDLQGLRAFVSNAGDDTLSVVDLDAGSVVATISTGDYPHGLRLSPDGQRGRAASTARPRSSHLAFSASHVVISSISPTCAAMMSSASFRICGFSPCSSSTSAMSMAP